MELANGTTLTSAVGYGLVYSTLDNNKNPTSGINLNWGQDFAGVGGDVSYMRSIVDWHSYYEPVSDLVSVLHLQAGDMLGLGTDTVRMLDDFKMGPNLVRGFQPAGIGPRDITNNAFGYGTGDDIGGTMYWGASLELQYPLYFLPKDSGFTGAVFVDSGSVWGYKGETSESRDRRGQRPDQRERRKFPVQRAAASRSKGRRLRHDLHRRHQRARCRPAPA